MKDDKHKAITATSAALKELYREIRAAKDVLYKLCKVDPKSDEVLKFTGEITGMIFARDILITKLKKGGKK